jgi:hypothetical protein
VQGWFSASRRPLMVGVSAVMPAPWPGSPAPG